MAEIVISNPDINMDVHMYWSYDCKELVAHLDSQLNTKGIRPDTHPLVADLCSGAGAVADLLIQRGWQPNKITCIDWSKTVSKLAPGAQWRYWDLKELSRAIKLAQPIPDECQVNRHGFDLVTLFGGFLGIENEVAVCNYLIKPSGCIIAVSSLTAY